MKIVNNKKQPKSIDDVRRGDIVLLGTGIEEDLSDDTWYAMAVGSDIGEHIDSYIDLECGESFSDIENYPIFEIIRGDSVQLVLPK